MIFNIVNFYKNLKKCSDPKYEIERVGDDKTPPNLEMVIEKNEKEALSWLAAKTIG